MPGTPHVLAAWSWPPRVRLPRPLREPPSAAPLPALSLRPRARGPGWVLGPGVPIRGRFLHRELKATSWKHAACGRPRGGPQSVTVPREVPKVPLHGAGLPALLAACLGDWVGGSRGARAGGGRPLPAAPHGAPWPRTEPAVVPGRGARPSTGIARPGRKRKRRLRGSPAPASLMNANIYHLHVKV